MDFSGIRRLDPVGLAGGAIGLTGAYVLDPLVRYIAPIAAASLIALTLNHVDSRIKGRFGTLGAASLTALAVVIDPIQDFAKGIAKGMLSLFSLFLVTAIGYQLATELHTRRRDDSNDDYESEH